MAVVALVPHHDRPAATNLARQLIAELESGRHDVRIPEPDAKATGLTDWAMPLPDATRGVDVAISMGGDGTMLRAVDLFAPGGVPVLGINLGHLGYLTEVDAPDAINALARVLAGDYLLETRMMLHVTALGTTYDALNEVVVEKTLAGHTIRAAVAFNDRPFTTYAADGLIVATPTGSTAYNLSARGPIVSPTHRALLLTPVSPHMLFDRAMVLAPDETLNIELLEGPPAALVVDGREVGVLNAGDVVQARAGEHDVKLVTFQHRNFHAILKQKFGLADR